MTVRLFAILGVLALSAGALALVAPLGAQTGQATGAGAKEGIDAARSALDVARRQQRSARARGERFEQAAARADASADRALQQSAALAARIQQAEAGITAAEAALALIARERRMLDRRLAAKREPLVRLTGALQAMARRPLALSALQRGSLTDLVHTRAVLASAIPRVQARTASLRADLDRARQLEQETATALAARRENSSVLANRRRELVALAGREKATLRQIAGAASREEQTVLRLASETRDLGDLVGRLEAAGSLRAQLAALPGPVIRPASPGAARPVPAAPDLLSAEASPPPAYQMPVSGRVLAGFGDSAEDGGRSQGLVMVPRGGAQVVAPGAGRVAFAGSYRGYGLIVIIEHGGGWTSLVTGLAALDTEVGTSLTAGSPIGLAPVRDPRIALELRSGGDTVNPLDHLR